MPITPQQIQVAQQQQFLAARDINSRVRVIAGPGTGKSRCLEERVDYLLSQGVLPTEIFVISFTRASSRDLEQRIVNYCTQTGRGLPAQGVSISTMHSLALRTVRSANLLQGFPADPNILDDWEQLNIFDAEFASAQTGIAPSRAREIRRAYDAQWQTLQALQHYNISPPVSAQEQLSFNSFHLTTRMVYSCLLPGEVVRTCVDQMRLGNINPAQLPGIKHLIVDEYQDLNECDQEFVRRIADAGASLFIAGDDDQSIYAFRYAAPNGIQDFLGVYPTASDYQLQYCFRCTPAILLPAGTLIQANPSRLPKTIQSLWPSANPPVNGSFHIWRFNYGVEEAQAIASSCRDLIVAGMSPDNILILVANVRLQVPLLIQELQILGLPYERPRRGWILDDPMPRLVFALLRLLQNSQNYVAHRTILGLQHRVGPGTCAGIAKRTVGANLNFRDLFYVAYPANTFSRSQDRAIQRVVSIIQQIVQWNLSDELGNRSADIETIIGTTYGSANTQSGQAAVLEWQSLSASLPTQMNLEELVSYLGSDTEAGQEQVLAATAARLGLPPAGTSQNLTGRIRILTMHGSKGLGGHVVFIPGLEMGVVPSRQALQAAGLVHEQRRLLYMSMTRSRSACILSLARTRVGQQAFAIIGKASVNQIPSIFINDIGVAPQNRLGGLTAAEIAAVTSDAANM